MADASLDWLDALPNLGVPGVPGVPAQKCAGFSGTPDAVPGVPGVPEVVRNTSEHQRNTCPMPEKWRKTALEHPEHPEHLKLIEGEGKGALPADIVAGLRRLRSMPIPRGVRASCWRDIAIDAGRLASDGWAYQALALGWEALALFGVDPSPDSHAWDESLAVILRGRTICAVDDAAVYVRTDGGLHLFNRRPRPGLTKFLWELGA